MNESTAKRFYLISLIATVVAVVVGIQMIRIQNTEAASKLLSEGELYEGETRIVYPDRGSIYDAKGRLIAGNETTYEVALDLNSVGQPKTVASIASSVLGLDYTEVLGYAETKPGNGNPYYRLLVDFVTADKIDQLETIKADYSSREAKGNEVIPSIDGLVWVPHSQRSYPEGELGSNITGFYSFLDRTGGSGYFGLEEAYDTQLSGTPREVFLAHNPQT